jgi:hypothetical protein
MNKRILALLLFVVLMLALIAAVLAGGNNGGNGEADPMKLPGTFIKMRVVDGSSSYFHITLSGITESNLWVADGSYFGWCADHATDLPRDTDIDVFLYSSLHPPAIEFSGVNLTSQRWDMVNYILNHKNGGARMDVQNALWHFVNISGSFAMNPSAKTLVIIADAQANGTGFTPAPSQVVAVLVVPRDLVRETAQLALIEVSMRE